MSPETSVTNDSMAEGERTWQDAEYMRSLLDENAEQAKTIERLRQESRQMLESLKVLCDAFDELREELCIQRGGK